MNEPKCSVPDDDHSTSGRVTRGMCNKHYLRWKNNGDPLIAKRRAKQAVTCERADCGRPGFMRGLCLAHYREVQKAERGSCSVEGCGESWQARGLCTIHYQRFLRTGSTDDPKEAGRPCSLEGCDGRVVALEMCQHHYANQRKYGMPEPPARQKKIRELLPCIQEGCTDLGTRKNGMCNRHYRKAIASSKPRCREPGCDRAVRVRGSNCPSHGGWSQDLRRTYGISAEQFEAMKAAQGGRCKICGKLPEELTTRVKRLVVDHDHKCCPGPRSCGKCVRGLLCNWCNRLIGFGEDDPELLRAGARYLEETKAGQLALFAA